MTSESKNLGSIGGAGISPVQHLRCGYAQGAHYVESKTNIRKDVADTCTNPQVGR